LGAGAEAALRKFVLLCAAILLALTALLRAGTPERAGLPPWLFRGSLVTLAVELPLILFTAFVEHVARRTLASSSVSDAVFSPTGGIATLAVKTRSTASLLRRAAERGVYLVAGIVVVAMVIVAIQGEASPKQLPQVSAKPVRDSADKQDPVPSPKQVGAPLEPKIASPARSPLIAVSSGFDHTCAIARGGAAYCWGFGYTGQLGNGIKTNSVTAVAVSGGLRFAHLESGDRSTCGVSTDGAAYCWGQEPDYDIRGSDYIASATPRRVADGVTFHALTVGANHSCGLTAAGAAICWGRNGAGQLGDGAQMNSIVPVAVSGGLRFVSLSAGNGYTCGVTTANEGYCWGADGFGQLGSGTVGQFMATPVLVAGDLRFAAISVGSYHTCGVTTRGAAYCWGADSLGELGSGAVSVPMGAPVPVAGGLTFASLALGTRHTCGLTRQGTTYCWGVNAGGQLGDGTTTTRLQPVPVAGGLTFASLTARGGLTCGVTTGGESYCWGMPVMGAVNERTSTPMRVGKLP
jgi:alpha-tubulin suppressor-like RCC1 family protein